MNKEFKIRNDKRKHKNELNKKRRKLTVLKMSVYQRQDYARQLRINAIRRMQKKQRKIDIKMLKQII